MSATPVHPEADARPPVDDETRRRFVDLWGRMGSTWGIPRTMAQVHAHLFITGEPCNTDDVMAALDISRGNASMTLRRLVDWQIIHRVHRRGDRKEYFQAEQDVWRMLRTIALQRKRREVDPILEELSEVRNASEAGPEAPELARLDGLLEVFRMVDALSEQLAGDDGEGFSLLPALLGAAR